MTIDYEWDVTSARPSGFVVRGKGWAWIGRLFITWQRGPDGPNAQPFHHRWRV